MSENGAPPVGRRPDRAALAIAVVIGLVAIAIAASTFFAGRGGAYSPIGPKTVPFIIAGALAILAVWTAVEAIRNEFPERPVQEIAPMAWIIGGLAVQMLTMRTVGFSVATGLLFAATAKGFGRGRLWLTIPIGIVFAGLVWMLFAKGLGLSLPAGPVEQPLALLWQAISTVALSIATLVKTAWTHSDS